MVVYLHSLNLYNAALFKKKKKKACYQDPFFPWKFWSANYVLCYSDLYLCWKSRERNAHKLQAAMANCMYGVSLRCGALVFLPGLFSCPLNSS